MRSLLKKHMNQGTLANGYLLSGFNLSELIDFLKNYGEVHCFENEFGIDNARRLKEIASQTSGLSSKVFFVIVASKMTREAPQAILKAIEDSLPNKHFFILAHNPDIVPETLRSRLVEIFHSPVGEISTDASRFLSGDLIFRARIVEDLADDKEKFLLFLDLLEREILDSNRHEFIPKLKRARESFLIFHVNPKMCLEYIANSF